MSAEENTALVRRYYEELWNRHDPAVADGPAGPGGLGRGERHGHGGEDLVQLRGLREEPGPPARDSDDSARQDDGHRRPQPLEPQPECQPVHAPHRDVAEDGVGAVLLGERHRPEPVPAEHGFLDDRSPARSERSPESQGRVPGGAPANELARTLSPAGGTAPAQAERPPAVGSGPQAGDRSVE